MYERFFELPLDRWELFSSYTLKRARIVLISDLTPTIDFFNADEVGIGGRNAEQAAAELNLTDEDKAKLQAMLRLRSYDVYTLRAAMAEFLTPEQFERLQLPEDEKLKLEEYTREYTRALFKLIFEEGNVEARDRQSMRQLLEGSSREVVQRNVLELAKKFNINSENLVNYIAGLGEMILAIGFYRRSFEQDKKPLENFLLDIKQLHDDRTAFYRHPQLRPRAWEILQLGAETHRKLSAYFESYRDLGNIWTNITPDRFKILRDGIEAQYPAVGAALCIWQVKVASWTARFGERGTRRRESTMDQRITFVLERIAPKLNVLEKHLAAITRMPSITN